MLFFFYFVFIKESKKKVSHVPKKTTRSSTTVSTLINQLIRFLKDHVTEDWSKDALTSRRDSLKKHKQILLIPNF